MIILWSILSLAGLVISIWYIKSTVFNRYGRINYPMFLWKMQGHYISWFLMLLCGFSAYMLYGLIPSAILIILKSLGILFIIFIIYKIGMAIGNLPLLIILIFALIGLIKFGLLGLIAGAIMGYIFNFIIGLISMIFTDFLDFGLIQKKYRLKLAEDFFNQNKEEISELFPFKTSKDRKIIKIFTKYINHIYNESNKLRNPPYKKHALDLDFAGYLPNFVEGAKNWLKRFKEEQEVKLMQRYVDFLTKAIYEESNKYI